MPSTNDGSPLGPGDSFSPEFRAYARELGEDVVGLYWSEREELFWRFRAWRALHVQHENGSDEMDSECKINGCSEDRYIGPLCRGHFHEFNTSDFAGGVDAWIEEQNGSDQCEEGSSE